MTELRVVGEKLSHALLKLDDLRPVTKLCLVFMKVGEECSGLVDRRRLFCESFDTIFKDDSGICKEIST